MLAGFNALIYTTEMLEYNLRGQMFFLILHASAPLTLNVVIWFSLQIMCYEDHPGLYQYWNCFNF